MDLAAIDIPIGGVFSMEQKTAAIDLVVYVLHNKFSKTRKRN